MIALLIAMVVGIILSKLCQWLMTQVGLLTGRLAAIAMQKQSRFLNGTAIAISAILRSYVALSFAAAVITYVQSSTHARDLVFALVTWPIAFVLANSPAWSSLRNYIRNFRATTEDKMTQSGGIFQQVRARRLHGEMYVHFMYVHNLVLCISVIGFVILIVFPALRTAGWGWVDRIVPRNVVTQRVNDPQKALCKTALMSFIRAHAMMSDESGRIVQLKKEQEEMMKSLIRSGITAASDVSNNYLTSVHPELPSQFRDHLVKGWQLYLNGLDQSDPSFQIQGIQLVQTWESFKAKNVDLLYYSIIE